MITYMSLTRPCDPYPRWCFPAPTPCGACYGESLRATGGAAMVGVPTSSIPRQQYAETLQLRESQRLSVGADGERRYHDSWQHA